MIIVENLSKTYSSLNNIKNALSQINVTIQEGQMFCIMGSSGSGKSTFLKILGGIEKFTSGDIVVDNRHMKDFDLNDYDKYRQNTVGYVFQDFNLLEGLTVKENIILPLTLQKNSDDEIEKKYQNIKQYIDVSNYENNYPEKLSGGEQQRTAICRALIKSPKILLADEPTGNLDSSNTKIVLNALININKSLKTTVIIVTHDAIVASYFKTVMFIENGNIHNILTKTGTTQSFYNLIVEESSKARGFYE